jgi:hypothetical protein
MAKQISLKRAHSIAFSSAFGTTKEAKNDKAKPLQRKRYLDNSNGRKYEVLVTRKSKSPLFPGTEYLLREQGGKYVFAAQGWNPKKRYWAGTTHSYGFPNESSVSDLKTKFKKGRI